MYEFDPKQTYRLVDIRDLAGNTKVQERALYRERVGCIAQNIERKEYCVDGETANVLEMKFVQDRDGRWICRYLRTSPVSEILEKENVIEVHTQNSIYVFESVELVPPVYQDTSNLIELYLSDEGHRFCKGFYYDEDKQPHELVCWIHVGMFVDSCLIFLHRPQTLGTIVCRYYIRSDSVEFYDTLYQQQEYSIPILIHNQTPKPMRVRFEFFDAVWTIPPWDRKIITPYSYDGTDDSPKHEVPDD